MSTEVEFTTIRVTKVTRDRLERFGKQHFEELRPTHADIVTSLLDLVEAMREEDGPKPSRASATRTESAAAP